jgi:hypothetical protein
MASEWLPIRLGDVGLKIGSGATLRERKAEAAILAAAVALRGTLLPRLVSGALRVEDAERFLEVRGP